MLEIWERAKRCGPQERALRLLAWALPDHEVEVLADFDLGLRDWHLLRLRRALFGPMFTGHGVCPHCGELLEVEFDARTLQDEAPLPPAPHYIDCAGRRYRLPSSRDLISVARLQDLNAAELELFARCCLDERSANAAEFSEVDSGLSALAAERNLQLDLSCAACGGTWLVAFDPGAFVWEEIEARAMALVDDVHRLAAAYGWSEGDILALSDTRRAAYLGRVH